MRHGGARPNSGPKKGAVYRKTREKLEELALLREMVKAEMEPMAQAQIASAKGFKYLVIRSKNGTFKRLKETPAPGEQVGTDDEVVEVWAKDPDTQAWADLMNRALGKPVETLSAQVNVEAGPKLAILLANRQKLKGNGHS